MGTISRLLFKRPIFYGSDASWGRPSRAIRSVLRGDATLFAQPPAEVAQDDIENVLGIGCMEYVPQVLSYGEMRQRIQLGWQVAPHLQGASEIWQANLCIDWPVPAANAPRRLHVEGVPTLIVHSVHDPSVAYKWRTVWRRRSKEATYSPAPVTDTPRTAPQPARSAIDRYLERPQAPADRVCRG